MSKKLFLNEALGKLLGLGSGLLLEKGWSYLKQKSEYSVNIRHFLAFAIA
jgi:hypothetical protein